MNTWGELSCILVDHSCDIWWNSPKFNWRMIWISGLRMCHQLLEINRLSYPNMCMGLVHWIFFAASWKYYICPGSAVKLPPACDWLFCVLTGYQVESRVLISTHPTTTSPCGALWSHSWRHYDHSAQCAWPAKPCGMPVHYRVKHLKFQGKKHISRSVRESFFKYSICCS